MDQYDVIVIGGGLEGIAHALRAAQEGGRVALFESRAEFGGRLGHVTPFEGGEAVSFAHTLWGIDPGTFRLLGLRPTELGLIPAPHLTVVAADGDALTLSADPGLLRTALDARAPFEIERVERLRAALVRGRHAQKKLQAAAETAPRRRGARAEDEAIAWARALGILSREEQCELMALTVRPMADYIDGFLSDALTKAALMAPALFAHSIGPKAPGSALGLLNAPPLIPATSDRLAMPLLVTAGGDGIHKALMSVLRDCGVTFEIGSKITELYVEKGGVTEVGLADGRRIRATQVISTLDPKATMLGLIDWNAMPGSLARRVGGLALKGSLARIFLRVDELPPEAAREMFKGPVYFNMDAADASADAWATGHIANRPPFEVTARAVEGPLKQTHVSAFAQFVPYTPHDGEWGQSHISGIVQKLTHELEKIWPGIGSHVKASVVWTPKDMETQFGWSHGSVGGSVPGPAALVSESGLPEFSSGRTPIEALYLGRPPKGAKRSSRRRMQAP